MSGKINLEERVLALEDDVARMKRENEDTLSNLETSNLGTEFSALIRNILERIKALEERSE